MELQDYIKPELLVLIPVLYLIGLGIKKSRVADKFIPLILGGIGIVLAALYVLPTCPLTDGNSVASALFTAITQGILTAGASVYINQLVVQSKKEE